MLKKTSLIAGLFVCLSLGVMNLATAIPLLYGSLFQNGVPDNEKGRLAVIDTGTGAITQIGLFGRIINDLVYDTKLRVYARDPYQNADDYGFCA
jgi:hypothetical protein